MLVTGLIPAIQSHLLANEANSGHPWSPLAAPDTGFGDQVQAASQPVIINRSHSIDSQILQLIPVTDNRAPKTTPIITSLFTITPPLVDIISPNYLDPKKGKPVVAPEPAAFLSGLICLLVLGFPKLWSTWKGRGNVQPLA